MAKNLDWSDAELEQLRRFYPTERTHVVAALVGRSVRAVYHKACMLRLKKAEGCHGNAARRRGPDAAA